MKNPAAFDLATVGLNACALCTDRPAVVIVVVDDESSARSEGLRYRKRGGLQSLAQSDVCSGCSEDLIRHGEGARMDAIRPDGTMEATFKVRLPWKAIIDGLRH